MMPTSSSLLDDLRSVFGTIRFRCTHCHHKQLVRVWAFRDTAYSHCPRCFSSYLQRWNYSFITPTFRRDLVRWLGGHCYRCLECSYAFISLRKANPRLRNDPGKDAQPELEPVEEYSYPDGYEDGAAYEKPLSQDSPEARDRREYAG